MDCFYKFKNSSWMIGTKPLTLTPAFEKKEAKDDINKKFQQAVEKAAVVAASATIANPLFSDIKQSVDKQAVFKVTLPLSTDNGISTSGPVDSMMVETFGGGTLRRCISLTRNLNSLGEEEDNEYPQDLTFFKGNKVDDFYDDDDNDDEDEGTDEFDELRFPFQHFTPMETIFEVNEDEIADT